MLGSPHVEHAPPSAVPARLALVCAFTTAGAAGAQTTIRIMPPDGATLAGGQRFDLRVEATAAEGASPPAGLRVTIDGVDLTALNVLAPGAGGERGLGGTGTAPGAPRLVATAPRVAKNVIFFLGDGMGTAYRTAARLVSRGLTRGKPNAPLAMDTLPVTGLVMTSSLDAAITDSAPGMAAYATGNKSNNHQEGVYPDNTDDPFDNPRVEYLAAMLTRERGEGFHVGIVTTADLTDATPAANAVHTAARAAGQGIAARYLDERNANGISVLLGQGLRRRGVRSAANG